MTSYCSSWLYSIHLNKVCWRCVVLTIYDRHRCQTIARYTGKFSPHLKVTLEFTLVLLNPFLKTHPDQLVSFRHHLIRIQDLHCFPH